jgi:hypothetical protein
MVRARIMVAALSLLAATARAGVHYDLDVRLDSRARTVSGRARITVENSGKLPLGELWLWRYPERLAERSPALNDFNFYWIYPYRFNPGAMRTGAVTVGGRAQSVEVVDHPRAGRRTLLRVTLDRPLAPGARAEVALDFETRVPERFGRFGCFHATCVLDGGFYPMLAGAGDDGAADLEAPPARASYRLRVSTPRVSDLVVNGDLRAVPAGGALTVEVPEARDLALVVGPPRLLRTEVDHNGVRVILYSASPPPGPPAPGLVLPYLPTNRGARLIKTVTEALDLLAELGRPVPAGETVRLVEGTLRIELAESLPGFTLISDQAFAIFPLDRFLKFHEFEVARALYAGIVERRAVEGGRERPGDLGWAPEVAAGWLVDRYTVRSFLHEEWAAQILTWVSFIPAIDRIIYAPQVPFASAYFYTLDDPDPLRDSLQQWNNTHPRGRLVYAKLRDVVGDEAIGEIARRQLDGAPLRASAAEVGKQPFDAFFAQWLAPYPAVDYRFAEIRSEPNGARWHHIVVVEKRGARPPVEPVEVRLRDRKGHVETQKWDGVGERHAYEFGTDAPISLVEIDPRGRLVENLPGANDDLRFDDRRPPRWKFVYNNFGGLVTVFPTFGLDLSLDFSLAPILDLKNSFRWIIYHSIATQIGLEFAYTRSFGSKITPGHLSQGLTSSLTIARLDPTFGFPIGAGENPGTRLNAAVTWGYDDRLFAWEPWRARSFSASASYGLIGLDSGLVLSQVAISGGGEWIAPIADGHGIALVASAGATFGDLRISQQMLTMGGAGALRGYAIDELLGRVVAYGRVEYRHVFVHSLDWNFLHALFVRGIGGGLFVEGGAMSNCGSYAMRPEGLAADVGYTLRIFGDWLGVSQTTLNIDFAVPLVHETRACFGNTLTTGTRAPIGFFFAFGPPW